MKRAFWFIAYVVFTAVPAIITYFTTLTGPATRENGMAGYMWRAGSPFFPVILILLVSIWLVVTVPIAFNLMPLSLKLRFPFYRNRRVKEVLYPAIQKAIEYDYDWKNAPYEFEGGGDKIVMFLAQLEFISAILSEFGIHIKVTNSQRWEPFIRSLAPFAEIGSYNHVHRLCHEFRSSQEPF